MVTLVHEEKKLFNCKMCDYSCIKKSDLNQRIELVHEVKNLVKHNETVHRNHEDTYLDEGFTIRNHEEKKTTQM